MRWRHAKRRVYAFGVVAARAQSAAPLTVPPTPARLYGPAYEELCSLALLTFNLAEKNMSDPLASENGDKANLSSQEEGLEPSFDQQTAVEAVGAPAGHTEQTTPSGLHPARFRTQLVSLC